MTKIDTKKQRWVYKKENIFTFVMRLLAISFKFDQ